MKTENVAFIVSGAMLLTCGVAMAAASYSDWSYCSGIVAWRTGTGTANFHEGAIADYDAQTSRFGTEYTLNTSQHPWDVFCEDAPNTSWTSPGLCLVYDSDTYRQSSDASFSSLSLGGLWVRSTAQGGTPYAITGTGTRYTNFGVNGTSSLFVFEKSFAISRASATRCYGNVTIDIASDAELANSASMWVENNSTVVLKGAGELSVDAGFNVNASATLDISNTSQPIRGDVHIYAGSTLVIDEGAFAAGSLAVCTGTLQIDGEINVQAGQTLYRNARVSVSGGSIASFHVADYTATITADSQWSDPTIWSTGEIPAGDLADKFIQVYTSNGAKLALPGELRGALVGVYGNGALIAANGSIAVLKDVSVTGKMLNEGEIRTEGDVVLSSTANEFASGSLLKVVTGCTSAAFASQGLKGDVYISPGAKLLSLSIDALWYNATSMITMDIYGTLDMGDSRWTLPNKDRLAFNLYAGALVEASGSNSNGYALDFFQSTAWVNVVTDGIVGGVATISAPIRIRGNTRLEVDGGMVLYVTGDVIQHGTDVRDLNKYGGGDVVFSGNLLWNGIMNIEEGGASISGGTQSSPIAFSGKVTKGELVILSDSVVDALSAASVGNIRVEVRSMLTAHPVGAPVVEENTRVVFVETAASDGIATVELEGIATVQDCVEIRRADGVTVVSEYNISQSGDVTVISFAPETSGQACWLDFEFNGNVDSTGRSSYSLNSSEVEYFTEGDVSGIRVSQSSDPWTGTDINYPAEWSAAIRAVAPEREGDLVVAFGTNGGGLIGLAKGTGDGEVNVVYTTSNVHYQVVGTANVASPTNSMHLYVFTKTADGVDVYCDGSLVNHCQVSGLAFGNAFQVGSVHGGLGNTGFTKPAAGSNSKMDFLRLYDSVIGPNMIAQLSEEYPYESTAGLYVRDVSQDGDWVETDAWTVEGAPASEPASADKAKVTALADATLAVNLSSTPNYETLTFEDGPGLLSLSAASGSARLSAAKLVVNGHVKAALDAVDFSGTAVELGPNGELAFDVTSLRESCGYLASTTRVRLTGVAAQGLNIAVESSDQVFADQVSVEYNGVDSCYEAVVAPRTVAADLCVTMSGGSVTIDDSTVLHLLGSNIVVVDGQQHIQYYETSVPATICAGDTLRILGGQATTYTFANTHGLEEVRIFDSGSSRAVTIASAPAAAVQVMMLGGANGRVEFTAEPGCQLAFDQSWKGTVVAGWSPSGKFVPDAYGVSGSTLVVNDFSSGYLATAANGVPNIAVALCLDGPMTLTNGFSTDSPWGVFTAFAKLTGTSQAAFTTWQSSNANKVTYYHVETLEDYKGSIAVSNRSAMRFENVVRAEAPGDGVYVAASVNGTGSFGGLKDTQVFVAGQNLFTGLAFDANAGGLVKAYAAIGDATYASVGDAILAANAANTATPGSVTAITLLNSPTIVDADIEAAGWRRNQGDPTSLEPFVPVVEHNSMLGGTIVIDTSSTWYNDYMAGNSGVTATTPAANGMTYAVCYALGLNPTDPNANVDGVSISVDGQGNVTVNLGGLSPNVRIFCQLQSRTSLPTAGDNAWTDDGPKVEYVNGSADMLSAQGTDPTKFYRVVLTLN